MTNLVMDFGEGEAFGDDGEGGGEGGKEGRR